MPMTPARIWLGGFRDSQLRQPQEKSKEESKSADKATTEATTDLAPTTLAKAWLERTKEAFFMKDVNANKPAQPEVAHQPTTQHGRRSAPSLMTMDASGYNVEINSGYFGPF